MKLLLAVECSVILIALTKSDIFRLFVGRVVCAPLTVGKGSIVGHYRGSLLYKRLGLCGSHLKTYDENIMKMTRETILR